VKGGEVSICMLIFHQFTTNEERKEVR